MKNRVLAFSGIFWVGASIGCADDAKEKEQECIFVHSPEECEDVNPTGGNDEAGDGDGDVPGCTTEPDGFERTVFQCNGRLSATIQFETLIGDCPKLLGNPKACQQSHEFGFGIEPYAMPAVMACCDAEGVPKDDVLMYCAADLVDQVCRSIPMRMQKLIDGNWLDDKKVAKKQAQALQDWLENNTQKCREALLHHSELPGVLEPRSFKAPNSAAWQLLDNFTITLDEAVVESTSLPAKSAEQLACSDAHFNDTELFEAKLPLFAGRDIEVPWLPGRTLVAALSSAEEDVYVRSSMVVDGRPVTGVGTVASACQQPRCASLRVTEHAGPGLLALEELELFATGPVSISHGPLSVDLEGTALRLYGASPAEQLRVEGEPLRAYMIPPRAAHFVISGRVGDHEDVRWGVNHSTIIIELDVDEVRIIDFVVEHVDGSGESWIVEVPATTWR